MSKRNLMAAAICAAAFTPPTAALAQTLDGAYRGTIVCEKVAVARDILHVPFDLIVHGQAVQFARPVFTLKARLAGSELGTGTLEPDGRLHASASRVFLGQTVDSEYSGTLTATGGALSGKQYWHGTNGDGSRTCHVALVPAPKAQQ
jgi:hypothetical protein